MISQVRIKTGRMLARLQSSWKTWKPSGAICISVKRIPRFSWPRRWNGWIAKPERPKILACIETLRKLATLDESHVATTDALRKARADVAKVESDLKLEVGASSDVAKQLSASQKNLDAAKKEVALLEELGREIERQSAAQEEAARLRKELGELDGTSGARKRAVGTRSERRGAKEL